MNFLVIFSLITGCANGFSVTSIAKHRYNSQLFAAPAQDDDGRELIQSAPLSSPVSRRGTLSSLAGGLIAATTSVNSASAAERAIGAAEKKCRENGNCFEKGDWDGAVGWQWGAKERCDAADPKCGVNGVLMDAAPEGSAVPVIASKITQKVQIRIKVGRQEEGTINLGLYGEASPQSVSQLVRFLSPEGLLTSSSSTYQSQPVALTTYGLGGLTEIVPNQLISFGLSSQASAYARANGNSSAGPEFVAQPRPAPSAEKEKSVRPHNQAGLLSIATRGVGYANSNCANDEAFANAFSITASPFPALDKSMKVIGQVLDSESMAFLARLSRLPPKKGFKGVIPGQNSGPPLLKTTVAKVIVEIVREKVEEKVEEEQSSSSSSSTDEASSSS